MQTYAVYLKPKSSFITWPTSDTLFGALCWAIYHLYTHDDREKLERLLSDFNKKPKFILSSAFPCWENDGNRIHFFPKPLIIELKSNDIQGLAKERIEQKANKETMDYRKQVILIHEKLKEIKKVSYVSESLFKEMVEGRLDMAQIYRRFRYRADGEKDIEKLGNYLISFGEMEKIDPKSQVKTLYGESDVLHNQVDRVAGSTVEGLLFFNQETFLRPSYGRLWFLVKTDDIDFLKPLLKYLQDTGIGSERTSGKGHFEISLDNKPYPLPEADNPNAFIILSRWFPEETEQNFGEGPARWNLLNMRPKRETMYSLKVAFISNNLLRMFGEGSVFPLKEKRAYYGRIEQIEFSGIHPIFRNGLALPVFTKVGG